MVTLSLLVSTRTTCSTNSEPASDGCSHSCRVRALHMLVATRDASKQQCFQTNSIIANFTLNSLGGWWLHFR